MNLTNELSIRIYLYKIAEADKSTSLEYLLAMARDILQMKQKIDITGVVNWTESQSDILDANRISQFYLRKMDELERSKKEVA